MSRTRVDRAALHPAAPRNRSPLAYVALTFALSIPFWVAGALTNFQILPALPVSALGLVCWGPRTLVRAPDFRRLAAQAAAASAIDAEVRR